MNIFAYQDSMAWIAYTPLPFLQMASFFSRYSNIQYIIQRGINLNLTFGVLQLLVLSALFTGIAVYVLHRQLIREPGMDDKNPFLDSYKKKLDNQNEPAQPPQADAPAGLSEPSKALRFEEKPSFFAPPPIAPSSRPTRSKVVPVIVVLVILGLVAAFLIWLLGRGTTAVDLTGWALTDAQLWAGENDVNLQVTEEYNDEFEAGQIISQDVRPGGTIEKGGFLKLKVSLGHDLNVTLPLPDLLEMTMQEVEAWAAENYMTKVRITTEYSDTVVSGHGEKKHPDLCDRVQRT